MLSAKISGELRSMDHVVLAPGVTLTPFVPDGAAAPTAAVIVCPGGSYHWLDEPTEGLSVAKWLRSEGIAAFVLRYAPGVSFHGKMYAAIDGAIAHVRSHCDDYGVDPEKIGAMGFSAGGHLVMSAAERLVGDRQSHLNFVAPIYPVITMHEPYVHKRSRRGLLNLSERHSSAALDAHSLEMQVRPDLPPVFLLNCADDPVVQYQNSELLAAALTSAGVRHLYTQYPSGGHGFGAMTSHQNEHTRLWQELFMSWFRGLNL